MPVHVTIKLFATFRKDRFAVREDDLPDGTRVSDVVTGLDIDPDAIGVILANGRHVELEHELRQDDVLAIFPVIGGG